MTTFINSGFSDSKLTFNESSPFPDGQPHVAIQDGLLNNYRDTQVINCRIVTPLDLVNVALAVETLENKGCLIHLNIFYLMGGRMDRRLSGDEPYTLKAVAELLNGLSSVTSVSVFCPHSQATTDLLLSSKNMVDVEELFFKHGAGSCLLTVSEGLKHNKSSDVSLVFPDHGALKRFGKSGLLDYFPNASVVTLEKDRDERTGKVNGVKLINGCVNRYCIIIDDLCDGGRTFEESSIILRRSGAVRVGLVVAHAIMSKGIKIPGIDHIVTTNSYKGWESTEGFKVFKL